MLKRFFGGILLIISYYFLPVMYFMEVEDRYSYGNLKRYSLSEIPGYGLLKILAIGLFIWSLSWSRSPLSSRRVFSRIIAGVIVFFICIQLLDLYNVLLKEWNSMVGFRVRGNIVGSTLEQAKQHFKYGFSYGILPVMYGALIFIFGKVKIYE
jgi:hypothetical protein